MQNKDVIEYYDKMASSIKAPTETRNKAKDFSQFDIDFMLQRASLNKRLLDLGSGTGLLVNHLVDRFRSITAIEKYPEFSKYIDSSKVTIINTDLLELTLADSEFDITSLFGVMNCFNFIEAETIYRNIHSYLKTGGQLVVKNQFGVEDDVTVSGHSEEIGTEYFSNYRHIDKEIALLEFCGFSDIQSFDIYPADYNRWENTHFFALTATKR